MLIKLRALFIALFLVILCANAQKKDSTKVSFIDSVKALSDTSKTKVTDSSKTTTDSAKNNVDSFYSTTSTAKVVKKLEDPRLGLSYELITRIKRMKPNQILIIDEKFVRNEKRVDEYGLEYEATVTVRFSFSQDMVTGIIKEVPLYNTSGRETNIIDVRIPIKFCCTTAIDTVHKKKHCGKMSELNDFEDNDGCKDWIQVEAGSGSKKSSGKPIVKGKGITGQTSVTGDSETDDDDEVDSFGKPISKKKKKGKKNKKGKEDDMEQSDSTQTVSKDSIHISKPSGKKIKGKKNKENEEENFGKPKDKKKKRDKKRKDEVDEEEEINNNSSENKTETDKPISAKDSATIQKAEPKKEEKVEPEKKKENTEEADFGKPSKKEKKKKKKKDNDKDSDENHTDTATTSPTKQVVEPKTEPKKEEKVESEKGKNLKTEGKKEE